MKQFWIGTLFGILILAAMVKILPGSVTEAYWKAILDCESTLPRDKHCIITARPE